MQTADEITVSQPLYDNNNFRFSFNFTFFRRSEKKADRKKVKTVYLENKRSERKIGENFECQLLNLIAFIEKEKVYVLCVKSFFSKLFWNAFFERERYNKRERHQKFFICLLFYLIKKSVIYELN